MKKRPSWISLLRWIIALVFIFSGFVKGVDPWGTAIKLREYFSAFGMEWLTGSEYTLSIALSALEMVLGFCLLFQIREKSVSLFVTLLLGLFTLVTLILALWNPVAECGCFGDFIKLTNWQTFWKNTVLLLFSIFVLRSVWHNRWGRQGRYVGMVEWSMVFLFSLFGVGIGMYSLRHLPLLDFLPFRVGVNIPASMEGGSEVKSTTLIYKDRTTGASHEFALSDTTWYDTVRWKYLDTRIVENPRQNEASIQSFALFDAKEDHAPALLSSNQEVFLITLTRLDQPLQPLCGDRLNEVTRYARERNYPIVCVTTSPLPASGRVDFGGESIPVCNIDGTTLKMLIRAKAGVVLLKEGVILGKWNCRDLPRFEQQYANRTPQEVVIERLDRQNRMWLLGIFGVVLMLIYVVYTAHPYKE